MQCDHVGFWIRIVGVGRRFQSVDIFANDPRFWIVFDAVFNSVQITREPAIHHFQRWFSSVSSLMEVRLHGHTLRLHGFVNADAVFGHDVPVVERMRHQQGGLQGTQIVQVVASGPERIVVARDAVKPIGHFFVTDIAVAGFAAIRIAAVDVIVQNVNVFADVSAGMPNQTMRAIIMIIRCVGGDRDDGFQSIDTGCGRCQGDRAVVGSAGHAHLARAPECFDLVVAGWCRKARGSTVQPVNHSFRCE